MEYYLLLIVVIFIIGIASIKKNKDIFLVTASFILALFSGFRYDVGVDYTNYISIFNGELGYYTREMGFSFLIDVLHYVGGTYQLMFLLLSCIFHYFSFKVIQYYSVNYWLSIIILLLIPPFYLSSFNGTRQYIAIVMFLYSLRFLDSKEYLKYFATCLLAALFFHQTILFIMLLFPIINKKMNIKMKVFLFVCMVLINTGLEVLLNYTSYTRYLFIESEAEVSKVTYFLFFASFMIFLFSEKLNYFRFKDTLLNINYFSFLCLCMVMLQSNEMMIQMFMRLNNYFFLGYIVLIPNLIYSFKGSTIKFFMATIVVLISLMYFVFTLFINGEEYNLIPFTFNLKLF